MGRLHFFHYSAWHALLLGGESLLQTWSSNCQPKTRASAVRRSLKEVGCGDLKVSLRSKPRSDEQKLHKIMRTLGMKSPVQLLAEKLAA